MPSRPPDPLDRLEDRLGHRFRDRGLLERALTHRSFAHEHPEALLPDNERLEFLGDAVLDLVVAEQLMMIHPEAREGELTRRKARLVNIRSLARRAHRLEVPELLHLGRGEAHAGGRLKTSVLGNAMEAILGALYLDGGLEPIRGLVTTWLEEPEDDGLKAEIKGRLQELAHLRQLENPRYEMVREAGPHHSPIFEVAVFLGDRELARGMGRSKKAAQTRAAEKACRILEEEVS